MKRNTRRWSNVGFILCAALFAVGQANADIKLDGVSVGTNQYNFHYNYGAVQTATVTSQKLSNSVLVRDGKTYTGSITNATVSGYGSILNAGGTITNATINAGGFLQNDNNGFIDTVIINGGTLQSGGFDAIGIINNVFFQSGTLFHGYYGAKIDNLIVGADATLVGSYLGNGLITNLSFEEGGTFLLGANKVIQNIFTGSVDFTNAHIVLSGFTLSGEGNDWETFNLNELFRFQDIGSFAKNDWEKQVRLENAELYEWRSAGDGVLEIRFAQPANETPEPATLLILGLGLVGLGIANTNGRNPIHTRPKDDGVIKR